MDIFAPAKWARYWAAVWILMNGGKFARRPMRLVPGLFTTVIDSWEGNVDLNAEAIWDGGVRGAAIRLNSISGGLRRDFLFDHQWSAFSNFARFPYFVLNPYLSAEVNFDWLMANVPKVVRRVGIDIEVKRDGLSPTAYAVMVQKFIGYCLTTPVAPVVYTGAWFLPLLAYWPTSVEYWWARYPYSMYPPTSMNITWEDLRARLEALEWYPAQPGVIPGACWLWQCSGDRFKLPGTGGRVMDINVANMTVENFRRWVNEAGDPQPVLSWVDSIDGWSRHQEVPYQGPYPGASWPG